MNKLGAAMLAAMLTLAATPARAQQWDFIPCMKMFEPKWCLDRELRKALPPRATTPAPVPLPRPSPKPAVREWRI